MKADGSASAGARLTTNPAFDGAPAYSPDGKWIAYRAQSRPGNEADKWRLMKYDRQAKTHAEVAHRLRPQREPARLDAGQPDDLLQRRGLRLPAGVPRARPPAARQASVTPATYAAEYALSARRQDAGRRAQQPAGAGRTGGAAGQRRRRPRVDLTQRRAARAARPAEGRTLHVRRRGRRQRPRRCC